MWHNFGLAVPLIIAVTLFLLSAAILNCCTLGKNLPASTIGTSRRTVIIDAGHGGFDGGAVANDGTAEKDINLNIAYSVAGMLKTCGFDCIMTRTADSGTVNNPNDSIKKRKVSDLTNRLELINAYPGATFVSIHLNKFTTSSVSGAQVFYSKNNNLCEPLGESIQQSIVSILQPENKRVIKQGTKSTYLLYNAKIPAVIVECGFLSNKEELQLLKSESYQKQMAFAVFNGILNFYNER